MKSINDVNFKGKKVLIRVDFNVPLDQNRRITDDTRIRESLSTIRLVLEKGGSVILMSHLGRPKAKFEPEYSLSPVVPILSGYLDRKVYFNTDLFSEKTIEAAKDLKPGEVLLMENLRYYPEEEAADIEFARKLAQMGDIYINDAFATAHREHASTATIAQFFPKDRYFGLLMEHELSNLDGVLTKAVPPFTAIIGGAKISSKIEIIRSLLPKVDNMIIGGGMAFTFIKALGGHIGDSLHEDDKVEAALEIMRQMMLTGVHLYIPVDIVAGDMFSNNAHVIEVPSYEIPDGWIGMDIGPKSRQYFTEVINRSRTILWNGPMGVFELEKFKHGTKKVAMAVASSTTAGAYSAIGGGDSVSAINMYDIADAISYVSTGGGAMLEYVEGKQLPGIKAILGK